MPTIRDLTVAIRRRPGIEAVVVLGRDGLLIDSQATIDLDAEGLAARVPGIVASADEIGATTGRGPMRIALLEQEQGYAIVSSIGDDAVLCVLTTHSADLGSLLYEVRRHRESIARLF
ncbi:MAG: roadblock/LC7 domain-containing protein [Gemmatimonadaceae bacterium]|jgi:predicted regulator of Ras-like GTPase activity (Roadblock/LC7/MglB family)